MKDFLFKSYYTRWDMLAFAATIIASTYVGYWAFLVLLGMLLLGFLIEVHI